MKKILVPFDLTPTCSEVIQYAMDLYPTGTTIDLLHIAQYRLGGKISEGYQESEKEVETREAVGKFVDEILYSKWAQKINVIVETGDIIDLIKDQVEKDDYELVIMGTKESHSVLDRWFGTHAYNVAIHVDIPVLLVPPKAHFDGLQQVLVASDTHIEDGQVLDFIRTWNQPYKTHVQFCHVQQSSTDQFEQQGGKIIESYFERNPVDFSFEISLLPKEDIATALLKRADDQQADLLMLVSEEHAPFADLIMKSISKELAVRSMVPLLFVPFSKS